MMRLSWKRQAPWLAAILLCASHVPPVAAADGGAAAAAESTRVNAQATATAAPVMVSGIEHTLLLQPGGAVWGWGRQHFGQLGMGEQGQIGTPTLVPGLSGGVKSVAVGQLHSFAIRADGTVWGWGYNGSGQVTGTDEAVSSPTRINNLSGVTALAAGQHYSLALKSGTILTWGANLWGQLGRGNGEDSRVPAAVPNLSQVVAIASGAQHALALKSDGSVWSWGGNDGGAVGDGSWTDRNAPVKVNGLPRVAKVAAGADSSFAVTADGTLWGWGRNDVGQLGNGTLTDQPTPVQVLTNVALVAPGGDHTLVLKKDGTVWGWGDNQAGQLGYTGANASSPVQIALPGQITGVAAGYNHSLAVKADGSILAWGSNGGGELGTGGPAEATPTPAVTALGLAITSPTVVQNVIRLGANKATLAGVTYPMASVAADFAGTTRTVTADASGKFSLKDLTFPGGQATVLGLTATTASGASSPRHEFSVIVDTAPPQVLGTSVRLIQTDGSETAVALTKNGTIYSGIVTAAAETVLQIAVDEPLSMITTNPSFKKFIIAQDGYDITLGDLRKGANKVSVELTDLVAKKSSFTLQLNYEAGPIMTITTPRSNPVFGAPKNGDSTIPVEFKGTGDEKIARLLVVNADTGSEITQVDMTGAASTSWKVTLQHDATQAGVWKYRFLGVDQAGYSSKPSATNADVRTVTIDPIAPQLSISSPYDLLVFTDGDDPHFAVEIKKLIFQGIASDEHSGVKQVTVGSAKATPARNSDPHSLAFKIPVALTDNGLTVVPVSAEDLVGNKSETTNYFAVMKTKISKLSASGTWYKQYDALKVTGSTDPAFNIGSKNDPYWVGAVPWELWYRQTAAAGAANTAESNLTGVPAGFTRLQMSSSAPSVSGGAFAQASCYDIATGKFSCYFDTRDLPDGKYTFYVLALPPNEFPDLTALKSKTFTVTIRR